MDFYGIKCKGSINIEVLSLLPGWTPADEGRIVYIQAGKKLYYGTNEGWAMTTSNGFNPVWVDSTYTAGPQDMCLCDSSKGTFSITLPPKPKEGAQIQFIDITGFFESHPIKVLRNGNTIQKFDKDFIIDIADVYCTLTYDPNVVHGWKVDIGGVSQVVGNTTLMTNRHQLVAEFDNQRLFNLPFIYNVNHNNLTIYKDGRLMYAYAKVSPTSISLDVGVPKGTLLDVLSIPLDAAYDLNSFITPKDLAGYLKISELKDNILNIDGSGSNIDADFLDGKHASAFVLYSEYKDSDVLNKIKKVDGEGSNLDADLVRGRQSSETPGAGNIIPIVRTKEKTLHPDFIPFGAGMMDTFKVIDIKTPINFIDLTDLDSKNGLFVMLNNITLDMELDSVNMYCKIFNNSTKTWGNIHHWSMEYSSHDLGPMREFNSHTDGVLARDMSSTGFNSYMYINGFNLTDTIQQASFEINTRLLSKSVAYVSNYRTTGVMAIGTPYSGLRLYTNKCNFVSGRIVIGRYVTSDLYK